MPHTFSVTVSDAEYKSLQYAAVDPEDWVENAVTTRCQVGGDKIISLLVAHCNANNVQIATGVPSDMRWCMANLRASTNVCGDLKP